MEAQVVCALIAIIIIIIIIAIVIVALRVSALVMLQIERFSFLVKRKEKNQKIILLILNVSSVAV